jgi:hypothetical protein
MKKVFKSPAIIVAIVLAFLIIAMHICIIRDLTQYPSGLVTEFVGIIVTVLFVQWLFDRKNIDNQKSDEKAKIVRSDKVVSLLVYRYTVLLHILTHYENEPLKIEDASLSNDFQIEDLAMLHKQCSLIGVGGFRSTISVFFEIELELRNMFVSLLQNIDYKFNKQLSDAQTKFVEASLDFACRDEIMDNEKVSLTSSEFSI